MGMLSKLFYGPNVALALLGGAGVLTMFLALFATAPAAETARKVGGVERRRTSLQHMIDQANLPITAGEFLKTGAILGVATTILGYVLLHTVTGAVLGSAIGPLAYWGYLGGRRDKTRRAYQEALARVATIVRDVLGRGGVPGGGAVPRWRESSWTADGAMPGWWPRRSGRLGPT